MLIYKDFKSIFYWNLKKDTITTYGSMYTQNESRSSLTKKKETYLCFGENRFLVADIFSYISHLSFLKDVNNFHSEILNDIGKKTLN